MGRTVEFDAWRGQRRRASSMKVPWSRGCTACSSHSSATTCKVHCSCWCYQLLFMQGCRMKEASPTNWMRRPAAPLCNPESHANLNLFRRVGIISPKLQKLHVHPSTPSVHLQTCELSSRLRWARLPAGFVGECPKAWFYRYELLVRNRDEFRVKKPKKLDVSARPELCFQASHVE